MAKKVRRDGERKEERKAVFEAPEFDERGYLEEQMENIKLTLFFIILGIPFGALWAYGSSAFGTATVGVGLVLAGYIAGAYLMPSLVGIDLLSGPKKRLASTFLMFFFTALAFSVLLSNPPVVDETEPSITDVMVAFHSDEATDGDWDMLKRLKKRLPKNDTNEDRFKQNPDQRLFLVDPTVTASVGSNISILVRAADASGLGGVWIQLGTVNIGEELLEMERVSKTRWEELGTDVDFELWGEHYYEYIITDAQPGTMYFRITVEDDHGNRSTWETEHSGEPIYVPD